MTVKYTDIVSLQNKYSVLRFNKLSYADIEVPENIPFESLIDELERDTNVIEISFNTYVENILALRLMTIAFQSKNIYQESR